jgi:hypothetical protein
MSDDWEWRAELVEHATEAKERLIDALEIAERDGGFWPEQLAELYAANDAGDVIVADVQAELERRRDT